MFLLQRYRREEQKSDSEDEEFVFVPAKQRKQQKMQRLLKGAQVSVLMLICFLLIDIQFQYYES